MNSYSAPGNINITRKNSLGESISDKKGKERMKRNTSTYNMIFNLNSVCSPWLCKGCGSKGIQDFSLLISNNINILVSEIFICKKIKETMILYINFWSWRVNKVHFPGPFNNRTILSYCSVSCVVQCALFDCVLFLAGEFIHLKRCNLCKNGIPEVFF